MEAFAEDELTALVARYAEAWERGDRDAWLECFHPAGTQEDPIGEGVRCGREEIGGFWDRAFATFDRIVIAPRAIHVVGGEAAMEWTITADGGPGGAAVFDGVDVFTFGAGAGGEPLIRSVRAYWTREGR